MTALNIIMDEMNEYINQHGPLPKSTSKTGFLNQWHDLDNEFWIAVLEQSLAIHENTKYHCSSWVEDDIYTLLKHIVNYGEHHDNILNPSLADQKHMHKRLTQVNTGTSIKSILWRAMMNIREQLYNPFMGIDLPNDSSSIGKLKPSPFESLFSWK